MILVLFLVYLVYEIMTIEWDVDNWLTDHSTAIPGGHNRVSVTYRAEWLGHIKRCRREDG